MTSELAKNSIKADKFSKQWVMFCRFQAEEIPTVQNTNVKFYSRNFHSYTFLSLQHLKPRLLKWPFSVKGLQVLYSYFKFMTKPYKEVKFHCHLFYWILLDNKVICAQLILSGCKRAYIFYSDKANWSEQRFIFPSI